MDPRYTAIVSAAVIVVLGGVVFLVRSFMRDWLMPASWCCGALKVRKSRSDSLVDKAASLLLLRPFRCTGCRERFYAPAFLNYGTKPLRPSQAPAPAHLPAASLQTQNPA